MRYDDLKADEIVYFVDQRQALHFEQVFEVAQMLGIAPNVEMTHRGFGTVNGADGKPFKTRDGGVMTLENLIKMSKDKVRESVPSADEVEGYSAEDIEKMVTQIAIGAIKFQDLKTIPRPDTSLTLTTLPSLTVKPALIFNMPLPASIPSSTKPKTLISTRERLI